MRRKLNLDPHELYEMRKQGMTNKQIAEALQISVKTVERHMTLALAELRENIS